MELKNIKKSIKDAEQFFYDLIYPKMCVFCGKYETFLCANCFEKIETVKTRTCFYCGKLCKNGKICTSCKKKYCSSISAAVWSGLYNDKILKELIHSYKYNGILEISEILSEMLTITIKNNIKYQDYIVVPVPLSRAKMSRRGFNQSEIIAKNISENLGISGGAAIARRRDTRSQVGLSRDERINNLKDSILCVDPDLINNRKILLIDDVATTGTTMNECAKVLLQNGAKRVDAAFIARG